MASSKLVQSSRGGGVQDRQTTTGGVSSPSGTSPTNSLGPKRPVPSHPHVLSREEVLHYFGVSQEGGLPHDKVEEHRQLYGLNVLAQKEGKSLWHLIGEQFEDLLVRILLAAAAISFGLAVLDGERNLGAFVEPLVILLILIANAIISIWQESNAEKSLDALKKLQPEVARVKRDRHWHTIPAQQLVPGDIVEVKVGDRIPADLRLIDLKTTTLKIEQSQLTGEAVSCCKTLDPLPTSMLECEIQCKSNILFSSTTVSHGHAIGVVVATGMQTEIGKIQQAVSDAIEDEEASPLQKKLDEFSQHLSKLIGVICLVVWLININHFRLPIHGSTLRGSIYYFKIAVALAVAAIPEGLPAVITTCLALGTRRMAMRRAIVRRLISVETLGCTTVICSDKTGTLTTNQMSVVNFFLPEREDKVAHYSVDGYSFHPVGAIWRLAAGIDSLRVEKFRHIENTPEHRSLQRLAEVCALCNDVTLELQADGEIKRVGEPTEAALKVLVEKLGCPDDALNSQNHQTKDRYSAEVFCEFWAADYSKLATLEFTRDRKSMSVLVQSRQMEPNLLLTKGAPESIIERCTTFMNSRGEIVPLTETGRAHFLGEVNIMAARALRTLALAIKFDTRELKHYTPGTVAQGVLADPAQFASIESNMTFIGVVGLLDPPRPGVRSAVNQCRQAGIRVIMITGDNKLTAEAIASQCGIAVPPVGAAAAINSMTGRAFEDLSMFDKRRVLSQPYGAVFSRTEPRHKQQIVKVLRSMGEVVAMTGDGVNDAPALKQADIGISMGISGTEVAKEASAMILADDNFETIVSAVEEGRSIFNNMKAFIRYLISSNIGEVASIFLTAALGVPEGLAPVQLLWVNLVTDGPPATALGFNPPDIDVMRKPPRRSDDKLITPWMMVRYFAIGIYVGIATVGVFIQYYVWDAANPDGHSTVGLGQLASFNHCTEWSGFTVNHMPGMTAGDACSFFTLGKIRASTLSLTVLVTIEMLNAMNAVSEDYSLFVQPPWSNPSLCVAIVSSMLLHAAILYIAPLAGIFGVTALSWHDWKMVLLWSVPVLIIDEGLKFFARSHHKFTRALYFSTWRIRHRANPETSPGKKL